MNDYNTVPNPAVQPRKKQSAPRPAPVPPPRIPAASPSQPHRKSRPAKAHKKRHNRKLLLLVIPLMGILTLGFVVLGSLVAVRVAFADTMLPGVYVGELHLGGLTQPEAAQVLSREWNQITLRDGERTWQVDPALLGITLDVPATVAAAFRQGHGEGGLSALFNRVQIAPVVSVDAAAMQSELERTANTFAVPALNAGVALVNGTVQATEPQMGRVLNIGATAAAVQADPGATLADGSLELVMDEVTPAVLDSSPLVAQAEALLNNPLDIRVYDPVTDDSVYWSAMPDVWGSWLTAAPDPNSAFGLALDVDTAQVQIYLQSQAANYLDASRSIDFAAGAENIRAAIAAGEPQNAFVTVQHQSRKHTVRSGESITSIAWDYGIPYLYIIEANNGLQSVSVGQEITIPPADMFLKLPPVPGKRIVVSISEQRTRVYENGALIWDWASSTGIADSPTWTGVYQIISHEPNAYAGNWNLWMPNFMGVYQPVPGADFTNGFHGFPTRGGGQLLWENSLGTRVTYGCILLSDANVQLLYNWAEEGVVVEILP